MEYCSITARHVVNHFSSIEAQWQIDSVKYSGNAFWVFVIFFYYLWRVVWSIKFDKRRYLCDNNFYCKKRRSVLKNFFSFSFKRYLGAWDIFLYFISEDRKFNFLYHVKMLWCSTLDFHILPFIIENISFFYKKPYPQKWTTKPLNSKVKPTKLRNANQLKKIFLFIATKCGVLLVLCYVK